MNAIAPAEVPSDLRRRVPVAKHKTDIKSTGGDKSGHLLQIKA